MATISTLAIRVALNTAAVVEGAHVVAQTVGKIADNVSGANQAIAASQKATAESASLWDKANASAGRHLKTVLGIAGAGAMVARSIKAASDAEQADAARGKGGDWQPKVQTLADSYRRLTASVDAAFAAFGRAFTNSANLHKTLDLLRGAVQSVTSVLGLLGNIAGTVFGWFVNTPPIFFAVAVALKIVAAAAVFLAQVLLTRLIVQMVTYLLLGKAMTPVTLAIAAAKYAWAAACIVASAAVTLLSAAMALLTAVGLPIWATLAVIVGAFALVVAGVVALTYALVKAWEQFVATDATADRIARMQEFAEATKEAREKIEDMEAALEKKIEQHGWTDQQKQLAEFIKLANELQNVAASHGVDIHDELQARVNAFADRQKVSAEQDAADERRKAALERQKELQSELNNLTREQFQAGMTSLEKRLDDLQRKGASPAQLAWAANAIEDAERQNQLAENRRTIEQEIANLQKEADQAGMTATEKRLADLRALGATEAQIAAARNAIAAADAAKEKQRLADRAKGIKDSVATPFENYQQKIAEIQKLLAKGLLDPVTAMRAADEAFKTFKGGLAGQGSREIASPEALLKGSAEAALAESKAKSPIDQLTDIQRQQLAEAKKATADLDKIAKAAKDGQPIVVGNF